MNLDVPLSVYVHIPFCRRRCFYCDFPVSVLGNRTRGEDSGGITRYLDWLCQEIEKIPTSRHRLKTIFFGGGTPSLLSVRQLGRVLEQLNRKFAIAADAEISMEIDPGTFDEEHLRGYLGLGINRVSLGVQAFQEELLQRCGRSHSLTDIFTAVGVIEKVGISNWSLDLISGLPHQTLDQWRESLEKAIAFSPAHLSSYDLIVEPVTPFSRQYQPGVQPLPSDETTAQMYRLASQLLTAAGYQHYEISNYAQDGYQCRHNQVYWHNQPYYGFGMGAASYTQNQRFTRPRTRQQYYRWVEEGSLISAPPLSSQDQLLETLMLGLRLAEGLSLTGLSAQFGEATLQQIWLCLQPYYQQDWVQVLSFSRQPQRDLNQLPTMGYLRLSDPEGFLFSNTVLTALFQAFSDE